MREKISIIGAGNVGSTLAFLVAINELTDVVLVDIVEGLAEGKALDISQAASLFESDCKILGTNDYSLITGSKIVVITAGVSRRPGMDRIELLKKNASIIKEVVLNIKKYAQDSIILVVTNPLDIMTYYAFKLSGFERKKVLGQAGLLDSFRFVNFFAHEMNVSVKNLQATIVGPHNDSMLLLPEYTTIFGAKISTFLKQERINELYKRTIKAGEEIVKLLKNSSAYYAPAASCFKMIKAIIKDKKYICCSSVYLDGEYSFSDVCLGVPVKLGADGLEEIIQLPLNQNERNLLYQASLECKRYIEQLDFS